MVTGTVVDEELEAPPRELIGLLTGWYGSQTPLTHTFPGGCLWSSCGGGRQRSLSQSTKLPTARGGGSPAS